MPLNSGGLWLPVTITPASRGSVRFACQTIGVVTWPIVVTPIPAARSPPTTASSRAGDDGRTSRPATAVASPRRRISLPNARPISRAASGVSSPSIRPRTSYSRKIEGATRMAAS
jgi:hypothetical protein